MSVWPGWEKVMRLQPCAPAKQYPACQIELHDLKRATEVYTAGLSVCLSVRLSGCLHIQSGIQLQGNNNCQEHFLPCGCQTSINHA